ncbi:hypothetical protein HDU86_008503 [Geranomyces michiganensis]|nr:hypothetical protein HDU86_008503 [Geranomyces michiganensis]
MFYSKDILTSKRRDGFAVIWLAATLGAKHSFKKLSKREVNQVNVVNACVELTSPKEPMALRLTQVQFLPHILTVIRFNTVLIAAQLEPHGEVNQVFHKVKRAWTEAKTADLDMAVPETRVEAITIDIDLDADLPMELPMNLDLEREKNLDFRWILQTPGLSANSTPILSHSPSAFASTSFGAPSLDVGSHVGSLKSITLDQSKSQAHHARPFGLEGTSGMILDGPFDEFLFGPLDDNNLPSQVVAGDDGQYDLFADLRADNEEVKRRRRERKGNDYHIDDIDFDFGAIIPTYEQDSHNAQIDHGENVFGALDIQHTEDITQPQATPGGQEPAAQKRQKKQRVLIDAATQITGAEFTEMRNQAGANLILAGRQAAIKERARKDKQILESIMNIPALATTHEFPGSRKKSKPAEAPVAKAEYSLQDADQGLQPFDFADMTSTGDTDDSVDDPEMLRAGDERRKSELMPWHKTSRAGSVVSDNTGSSRPGSARKRRNSVSGLGDDFALDPMRRPSLSVYGDQPDFGELEDRGFRDDSFFGAVGEPLSSDERELNQFLNYVKDILVSANSNYVHFLDLLPVDATSRVAASRAFYHVLSLGTRDMIIPTQSAPYEDIRIQIK